jgi:uncharacterized SAM-binding protein YcdF (DUF218 family)
VLRNENTPIDQLDHLAKQLQKWKRYDVAASPADAELVFFAQQKGPERYHRVTLSDWLPRAAVTPGRPPDVNPLELLKFIGGPGSIGFLVASVVFGLLLRRLRPQHALAWRALIGSVCGLYLILSVPVVGYTIAGWLPPLTPGARPVRGSLDTLVVFDGDNRRGRLREGLRVWNDVSPDEVIVSGGEWLMDGFRQGGVPSARLKQDASAGTTRAQVDWTATLAADRPGTRIGVVASALQMPRVEALMRAGGLRVVLLPSPVDAEPVTRGWRAWVPSYLALRLSRDALYELAALRYYARRGWIASS